MKKTIMILLTGVLCIVAVLSIGAEENHGVIKVLNKDKSSLQEIQRYAIEDVRLARDEYELLAENSSVINDGSGFGKSNLGIQNHHDDSGTCVHDGHSDNDDCDDSGTCGHDGCSDNDDCDDSGTLTTTIAMILVPVFTMVILTTTIAMILVPVFTMVVLTATIAMILVPVVKMVVLIAMVVVTVTITNIIMDMDTTTDIMDIMDIMDTITVTITDIMVAKVEATVTETDKLWKNRICHT